MIIPTEKLDRAVAILKKGGLVAFPTDTVYGLGAHALLKEAVVRVYEVKGRPSRQPLPLMILDKSRLPEIATDISPATWLLIETYMPGGLTLVLKRNPSFSSAALVGGETVALRIPNHPVPLALLKGLGAPVTGTSANLSGHPDPLTADDVRRQIGDKVDFILDGGRCPGGVASTVVDFTTASPKILREGAIPREEIEKTLSVKMA